MAGVYGSNFDYGMSYYKDDAAPGSSRHEKAQRRMWPIKSIIDASTDIIQDKT